MNFCKQCHKEIPENRSFCSKSCAMTYRNLLPENRKRSSEMCKKRNSTIEMKQSASKNMKKLRKSWETDPRIKEIYTEVRRSNMISLNKSQGMNNPKYSEDLAETILRDSGISYEREKRIEFDDTRNSIGQFSNSYARCDYYLTKYDIDLEIDGSIHLQDSQKSHDKHRDERLRSLGILVHRIDYTGDDEKFIEKIHEFIGTLGGNNE